MWKVKRRGRPVSLWNRPEHTARYEELRAFFAREYPTLRATFINGLAQQTLVYEVSKQQAPQGVDVPLPDSIIPTDS